MSDYSELKFHAENMLKSDDLYCEEFYVHDNAKAVLKLIAENEALRQELSEKNAEFQLASRYLRQSLAALNPRSGLSCDIRRLIGMNPMAPKVTHD